MEEVWAGVFLLVLLASGTGAWRYGERPCLRPAPRQPIVTQISEKPSIAVLPFSNVTGDPEQAYFADGMTDDLITDLTKISGLLVIDRDSSFAYRGRSPDIREAAQRLSVRYVLHGSVRRKDNNREARELYRKATELDPVFARTLAFPSSKWKLPIPSSTREILAT